jgi:hypothetical protein
VGGGFDDFALKELHRGGAQEIALSLLPWRRRPADFARRFSSVKTSKPKASASKDVERS